MKLTNLEQEFLTIFKEKIKSKELIVKINSLTKEYIKIEIIKNEETLYIFGFDLPKIHDIKTIDCVKGWLSHNILYKVLCFCKHIIIDKIEEKEKEEEKEEERKMQENINLIK